MKKSKATKSRKRKSTKFVTKHPDVVLKKKKISQRTARLAEELTMKNASILKNFEKTGMVTTRRPSNPDLELIVTDETEQCDNMNITKKAGRGKIQHLFVLPGHMEILQFANNKSSKRKSSQASQASQASQVSQASQPSQPSQPSQVSQLSSQQNPEEESCKNKVMTDLTTSSDTSSTGTSGSAEAADPFLSPDCFGSVTDLGTGNPVMYIDVPNRKGKLKLVGTILNPTAPLMALQLPSNKNRDGQNITCDSTFESIVVFNKISWVSNSNLDRKGKGKGDGSGNSISSSSSLSPPPLPVAAGHLPSMETTALGSVQTKFDLRLFKNQNKQDD